MTARYGGVVDLFSFWCLGRRLSFAWERDAKGLRRAVQFADEVHARHFLDAYVAPEEPLLKLRALLDESPMLCGERYLTEDELLDTLAQHLARRTLLVVDGKALRGASPGASPPRPSPPKPTPQHPAKPTPPQPTKTSRSGTWTR